MKTSVAHIQYNCRLN